MWQKSIFSLTGLLLLLAFGQCSRSRDLSKQNAPPPPPTAAQGTDQGCYKNGTLSASERLGKYPFNKTHQVVYISYEAEAGATPVVHGRIDPARIREMKVLDKPQVNELTDLIFNYNYSKKTTLTTEQEAGCYRPRHSILFMDIKGQVFAYLEICFECSKYKSSEAGLNLGTMCAGKLERLKGLFGRAGIH
ncbi:MAG: hypothetical protein BGO31_10675 [Bacteroidetes bacterium 43-16]|nr:MAG: hypothetical protein BGO31_10675 [Bacteroidetes bacterium 43-16]